MILVLNFDKNPLYRQCDDITNLDIELRSELYYELGYNLSDMSGEMVEDKAHLLLGLIGKETDVFQAINNQVDRIINILTSDTPSGNYEMAFPPRYIDWLRYNGNQAYRAIADALDANQGRINVKIDDLYEQIFTDNIIRKATNAIKEDKGLKQFFVSGVPTSSNNRFVKDINNTCPDIEFIDNNNESFLWTLVRNLETKGETEYAIKFCKQIDTFDSWLHIIKTQLTTEPSGVKSSIQSAKDKTDDEQRKNALLNLERALTIQESNNYSSIAKEFSNWANEGDLSTNILTYIAEKRADNPEEAAVWHLNSGDDGIIKAAYIYLGIAQTAAKKLSTSLDSASDILWTAVCNARTTCDKHPDKDNMHIQYILAECSLAVMRRNMAHLKTKGVEQILIDTLHNPDELIALSNRVYNRCIGNYENALSSGGTTKEFPDIRTDIKQICDEYSRIFQEYKDKNEALEASQKAENEARIQLIRKKYRYEYNMVFVPGGSFSMGRNSRDPLAHEHKVKISPFMVMDNVITEKFYAVVMETVAENGNRAMSWSDLQDFVWRLNSISGENFSVISEAQYEWLCKRTMNMHQSHEEYCADDYDAYPYTEQTDPIITVNDVLGYADKVVRDGMTRLKCNPYNEAKYARLVRKATQEEIDEYEESKRRRIEEEEQQRLKEEQLEESKQKAQEADFRKHVETLKKHAAELEANAANGIPYTPEPQADIREAIDYFYYDHIASNGGKKWHVRATRYGYNWSELNWLVKSIIGYYCCRQTYITDNPGKFSLDFVGEMPWITMEYHKLLGFCSAYGIKCDISYSYAYGCIKDSVKGPLVDKIKEYYDLDQQRRENGDNSVAPPVNDLIKLSDIFMNGDEAAGIHKDPRFAFIILKKAADRKSEEAKKRLARCYYEGIGVKKNIFTAKDLYPNIEKSMAQKRAITNKQNTSANNVKAKTGKKKKSTAKSIMGGCLFMIIGFGLLFLAFILSILF